jgi:tRNA dimethylallyltransferase
VKPKLIVIGGPTASGKSALAVKAALEFKTEIISADSRQFYREMNVGTAKPERWQLELVKHHFIDSLSVHDTYSAGQYETDCLNKLETLFRSYPVVIMAGGSGLFIDAVLNGFSRQLPESDPEIRERLNKLSLAELQEKVKKLDPLFAASADLNNPRRLIRALEAMMITGKTFSEIKKEAPVKRNFDSLLICLDLNRSELYRNIEQRVDKMISDGLEEEAFSLFPLRHLKALKTVGYSEWFLHFEGKISKEETIRLIKRNSRRYAKRQLTWFRNQHQAFWIHPQNTSMLFQKLRLFSES